MSKKMILSIATLSVAVLLIFYSCTKNGKGVNLIQQTPIISVEQSKSWLEDKLLSYSADMSRNSGPAHGYLGIPNWERNYPVKFNTEGGILKIPLENYDLAPLGYRDLLFSQNADGKIGAVVLEVRPDSVYLRSKIRKKAQKDKDMRYYIDTEDFSGDLLLYNTSNRFIKGRRYENGVLKFDLLPGNSSSFSRATTEMTGNNEEGYTLPEVVVTAPAPNSPPLTPWVNPNPNPGTINPPTSPFPVGGGGSNTGYNTTAATSGNVTVTEIRNNLSNPCLQAMLNAALSNQLKSWVATTVNSLGGNAGNYNFIFRERAVGSFASADVLGQYNSFDSYFSGNTTNPRQYGTIYIDLNYDSLPGKPKEIIATAIYHEILHGILAINGVKLDLQHEAMAETYRQKISEGLKALFPAMSSSDASALGWLGLVKTYQFSSLRVKDFQNYTGTALDILKAVFAYQTGQKGTPSGCK